MIWYIAAYLFGAFSGVCAMLVYAALADLKRYEGLCEIEGDPEKITREL